MDTYIVRVANSVVVEADSLSEAKRIASQYMDSVPSVIHTVVESAIKSDYMGA